MFYGLFLGLPLFSCSILILPFLKPSAGGADGPSGLAVAASRAGLRTRPSLNKLPPWQFAPGLPCASCARSCSASRSASRPVGGRFEASCWLRKDVGLRSVAFHSYSPFFWLLWLLVSIFMAFWPSGGAGPKSDSPPEMIGLATWGATYLGSPRGDG